MVLSYGKSHRDEQSFEPDVGALRRNKTKYPARSFSPSESESRMTLLAFMASYMAIYDFLATIMLLSIGMMTFGS